MSHNPTDHRDLRARLVKLVRDRIAQFIAVDAIASYELVDHDTHVRLLRRKLMEEAVEYLEDPSIGELADVLEVVECLAAVDLGVGIAAVHNEKVAKFDERGGFLEGTAMFVRSTAPPRHEGEHG